MSIPLGISQGGISIRNSQVTIVSPKGLAIKLQAIIRDKGTRDPKSGDYVFPNKFLGIYVPDICQGFNLDPLSEVIRAN